MTFPSRPEYESLVYGVLDDYARKPAPGISFTAPNLPTLIADCIALDERALDEGE